MVGINASFEIHGLDIQTITAVKLLNFFIKIPVFEGLHLGGHF
jgi:hypothetical protein